jgi:polyphenol oxidase
MPMHAGWITPQWPAPANVRAICTTRAGGVSRGNYESLNLGDHVGDTSQAVASNRNLFSESIGARPVFLEQVHGREITRLAPDCRDGARADGCVTGSSGLACTIMVADCLPILFADSRGKFVAAAHAGWRGLAGANGNGIVEAAWHRLQLDHGARAQDILIWLGPCIGPTAFEVGDEVKAVFEAHSPDADPMFKPHAQGKWLANLQGLARQRLAALGLASVYGNDGTASWCTVGNPSRFFSHRRDRVSGRFAASVWLV